MPRKKRTAKEEFKKDWKEEMKKGWKCHHEGSCGCHHHHKVLCGLWFAAWLFTVGLLKLTFWKAVFAIVIWAYYLGTYAATIWHP